MASNDRLGMGSREGHGDFYTSETDEVVEKMDEPWEENRSMSESYGFNRTDSLENYLSADELIEMFVRIVAKGGNLNLMVTQNIRKSSLFFRNKLIFSRKQTKIIF